MRTIGKISVAALVLSLVSSPGNDADAGLFDHCRAESASCCCCDPCPSAQPCCDPCPVACPPPAPCPPPPPPPVEVILCVEDPVTCCVYEVSVCVPACCAAEAPSYEGCRRGLFKRKILTYNWACCDHCVDIVITKHGRTIVRD